ncbi:LuxR family transcriptional regulator [Kitasatospora sp. RB6PN24]|uniref:LuxR family transcriptional regulator n=1 Tax=Kitasatospora humi TaxID=2893891 RepID=UPI001E4759A1|nr:LuxR family transcriptional regulator [Kitasatospora humi]MCC9311267.1 LuxR family transcriptional regulator [Kitasatospora humi]
MTVDGVDGLTVRVPVLPDALARALYLALLANGGVFRPADVPEGDAGALERLRAAGLVVELPDGHWGLVDPRRAAGLLQAEYRSTGIELLLRAEQPVAVLDDLAVAYERTPRPLDVGLITNLSVLTEIQQRLENLAMDCEQEILGMQPGGGRAAATLRLAKASATQWRNRGVGMRIIYQPGARTDPATVDYAAHVTALGWRVRILDEPFHRALVFDRRVAVVSGYRDNTVASFIEDPVLVALVVDRFERDWARAERVRWNRSSKPDPLVPLLAQGLTQRAIAKRLRLSERTVAAQIARLREEYDAESLFQLGWQVRGEQPDP